MNILYFEKKYLFMDNLGFYDIKYFILYRCIIIAFIKMIRQGFSNNFIFFNKYTYSFL